jgi:transcription elongation GreA/GreB family factor
MSVSPQSPLGSKLIGMKQGDTATINGKDYRIEGII